MAILDHIDLIKKCIEDYTLNKSNFDKMEDYYRGKTDAIKQYKEITSRSNSKINTNFIKKFIKQEVSYVVGNNITYLSNSGDESLIDAIKLNIKHWSEKQDQNLLKNCLKFGTSYELYYIDDSKQFNARILSPRNAYALEDDFGNVQLFLHFFKLKFDDNEYLDVYTDKQIEHYKVNGSDPEKIEEPTIHYFGQVPVSVCVVNEEKEDDTNFSDIKASQDAYETILSDGCNEISDFRNAYLKFINCQLENNQLTEMKKLGIMNLPGEKADAQWLIKNIDATFVNFMLTTLQDNMYQISGHINSNEKMQSNTSSLALRARLITVIQKCVQHMKALNDTIKIRMKLLCKYLQITQGLEYDYRDIYPKFTPLIPQDDLMMAQIFSQLPNVFSKETQRSQFSFCDNPAVEEDKFQKEQKEDPSNIGDEILNNPGGGVNG